MTTVFLDSNIYRQLGLNFSAHQDYIRLKDFLNKTHNEFALLKVVEREILDYIEIDVYEHLQKEVLTLKSRLDKNPFIAADLIPNINEKILEGSKAAKQQFDIHSIRLESRHYPASELISFLLDNKRGGNRKDNTRDFLIVCDLIKFCQAEKRDEVVLISEDEFFFSNNYVRELILKNEIENFFVFKSISLFLKDFGPKFEFITEKLVLASVSEEEIRSELISDIKCFPSYISKYYYGKNESNVPNLETLDINGVSVHDIYVTKNLNSDTYSIQFSLAVAIKAVYEPEHDLNELNNFRKRSEYNESHLHEIFDKENRPIYEHKVLFVYQGEVNKVNETIDNIQFKDFFPDHFLLEEYMEKLKRERVIIQPQFFCRDGMNHAFDTVNGIFKPSQYGLGLTLHYRCNECGALYDTGDSFD